MENKKPFIPSRLLVSIGLLMVTVPLLVNNVSAPYFKIPDFFRGAMMGFGLVMEMAGIVIMMREKNSPCRLKKQD